MNLIRDSVLQQGQGICYASVLGFVRSFSLPFENLIPPLGKY